ncbi:epimerase family protein SDR39U1 [Drosophila obscura]|uniref:epimerase family protein SDR39U1 n=1 Tax=Drosophila obscura TaxID=7282 RepID=UPI000BA10776|nr:epimerase family protein SDR39U1 [Drosophila obscura]
MSKHTLIGGGTGYIGKSLSKHLSLKGYDVTLISRMPGPKRITWHELEKNGIPNSVNSVVNVTGQNVLDPSRRWTPGFQQNVWNSRINSSKALANALTAAPQVTSFVNLCGVSHYKPSASKVYTEDDKVESYDYMSRLCVAWEEAAHTGGEQDCKCAIVRTGAVVGLGGGMIESIWLPFKLGVGGPLGTGQQIMPWIHMLDLCSLIQHIIEKCESGVFNGVAPEIVTSTEFSKAFAKALNRPCIFNVPEFVVHAIFGKERAALLLSGAKIQPKKALSSGFQFKYPTAKAACAQLVEK